MPYIAGFEMISAVAMNFGTNARVSRGRLPYTSQYDGGSSIEPPARLTARVMQR